MKSIVTFLLIFVCAWVMAQEQDTTSVDPDIPLIDSTKVDVPALDSVPKVNPGTSPKIIYYQTIPEDQKNSKRKDIRTLSGSMSHSGGFGALSFRTTKFRNEAMVLAGVRGGWIINRTLGFGLEAHGIIPTAKYSDVDPMGDVVALGGYGGMFMELIFFSNEVVHVTFPVSGGAGWMGFHYDFDQDNLPTPGNNIVDEDVYWYVEPGAGLEVNLSRSFRLAFGASKRFTQDLDLINTRPTDFNKMNYYVTIKVGGF